jgi:hypothetical protein
VVGDGCCCIAGAHGDKHVDQVDDQRIANDGFGALLLVSSDLDLAPRPAQRLLIRLVPGRLGPAGDQIRSANHNNHPS